MISSLRTSLLRSIRQTAGAAILVAAATVSSGTTPAAAFESTVAATLAAEAATDGAVSLASKAAPVVPAQLATANIAAVRTAALNLDGLSRTGLDRQVLNANAAISTPARRRVAASPYDRRILPMRTSLNCAGVWCDRPFVLMLGVAY